MVQLHTEEWPDLTAPEEPRCAADFIFWLIFRLLLDLVQKAYTLQEDKKVKQPDQKPGHQVPLFPPFKFAFQAKSWSTAVLELGELEPS